ncbi:MAG TPA: sigma-70 family RNA polymerase sigma factor [Acidimicrobiales bacterium]|nr:sigma-70 family RNA polymerase sigma factor [Acidimicrobiales bacterium]
MTGEVRPRLRVAPETADAAAAFDALFVRERTAMVRVAYLLVGSEPIAEEIVQEAFAAVYARWDRIDNPGGFLRQCVVNGARSSLRRRSLERRKAQLLVDEGTLPAGRELLDALAALPIGWRSVVVLRFYEGMTQEEIAVALDMRLGTVKSSLHRGLAKLREALEP